MSEPGRLLEIPDESPRQWRGPLTAAVAAAVVIVAGVVVARTFALGGTVRPWLTVQAVIALPALLVAWFLCGPHPRRSWIAAAVMLVGLIVQPLATAGVTPSPDRLAQIIDALDLPGETVRDIKVGNSRCRPACSELRRTGVVKGIAFIKAKGQIDSIMRAHGFTVKEYGHRVGEPTRIDVSNDDLLGQFELRFVALGETRIAQVWIARGPASDVEIG